MRAFIALLSAGLVIAVTLLARATQEAEPVAVRLRLVDAEGGRGVGGIVRVLAGDKPLAVPGLLNRLRGLGQAESAGWYVLPAGGATVRLPPTDLRIEATSGLEWGLTTRRADLAKGGAAELSIKLAPAFRPERHGLVAGNTHLHLKNLTRAEADEYLRQVPAADGLKVLFLSYLERHKDDATYITNEYPVGRLDAFDKTGVLLDNGEEHRHNFGPSGQGYGHVMFLGIRRLVKPVSLGPGITGGGDDDRPLRPGIDDAKGQGGTVIWCHNANGHEDVPSFLAGRLDALNVFDGTRLGTYEHNYYRYLNLGMRLPISTGTDWFLYDFSRVYAKVDGPLTPAAWLDALKAGRAVATNGPLLTLSVDGQPVGGVVKLDAPRPVKVEAAAVGRHDFGKLQLVHNGRVVDTVTARQEGGAWSARLAKEVPLAGPAWFATRIEAKQRNELDAVLFAHTSPVYVDVGGGRVFDVEAARALRERLQEARADIRSRGQFSNPEALQNVLALYELAEADLRERINTRGKAPGPR